MYSQVSKIWSPAHMRQVDFVAMKQKFIIVIYILTDFVSVFLIFLFDVTTLAVPFHLLSLLSTAEWPENLHLYTEIGNRL